MRSIKSIHPVLMVVAILLVVVCFDALRPTSGAAESAQPALREFMRQKLDASNQILEGLVVEDFEMVGQGAKQLREISSSEKWRISNDAIYRQFSGEFQGVVERLEKAAKEKKLEGATLIWIEATMSCIECHKYARSILIADGRESLRIQDAAHR